LEAKAARKQAVLEEVRVRKIAAEESKEQRKVLKLEKL
jgi:stress response protein YsnF